MQNFNIVRRAMTCLAFVCFAVIAIPIQAQTYSVLTLLHPPYARSSTPLIQGFDGNFYGTGTYNGTKGLVFRLTPDGVPSVVYSFCSQPKCTDGADPSGLILGRDGNFYGTTLSGGAVNSANGGLGTVFKLTPQGVLTTLHSFCGQNCGEGSGPNAVVQAANGSFFGTTISGGAHNFGTVFKVTPQGVLTTLYSFCSQTNCADGMDPESALLLASDGNFYGTTTNETVTSTLFKVTPAGKLTILHTFCIDVTTCLDGDVPVGALVQGPDGNLYGVNHSGGTEGGGTIYTTTTKGQLTTLYNFCGKSDCPNGSGPFAGMILASDENFYGTTNFGGDRANGGCGPGCGTIYQFTPQSALTTLYEFCPQKKCLDGNNPSSTLLQGTDGSFYGMANPGQNRGSSGLIFKLDVGLPSFVKTLPTTGKAGVNVVILGNNLTGTTAVEFNGVAATFKVVSNTEITAKVPVGATTGTVTVTTPSGSRNSNVAFIVP